DGQSWSPAVRVNDDSTVNSQFFPRIAVDPVTGNVALSWYDARNDTGVPGSGSRDAVVNNDVEFYGVVGSPVAGGVQFSANVQVTPPNGFVFQPQFIRARRRGAVVTASYRFAPPGGPRAVGPGTYTIALEPDQVATLAGRFAAARSFFGTFVV